MKLTRTRKSLSGTGPSRGVGANGAGTWLVLGATLSVTGCDGRIGRPELLWLLWLVPLVALFFFWSSRRRQQLLEQFASSELLSRLTGHTSPQRQAFKAGLVVVALSLLLLSLAEIKYGFTWEEVRRRGVDIVVALDVSDSMLVEDAEQGGKLPRLERAKREIADLLRLLEGDRIGLVAFAGTAFLECPLTLDYGAAELFLDAIDTDLIPVKGTAIGEALNTSIEAFEEGPDRSRAIILITDGEDHQGEALQIAEMAGEKGIRIFPIGIGRDEGAPIPQPGGGFRRDRSGEIILSRLDEPTLQRIALTTGGRYVRSVTGDVDLEQIYLQGIKVSLEDQELGASRRERWKERFQWLLAGALVLLMLEPLLSERRRSLPRAAAGVGVVLLGLLVHMSPVPVMAQQAAQESAGQTPVGPVDQGVDQDAVVDPDAPAPGEPGRGGATPPDDPYDAYRDGYYDEALQGFLDTEVERPTDEDLQLNIGSAHYQMRDYESAARSYQRAAGAQDPVLRSQALYNLGNTAYRQGRLGDAIDLYMSALELNPDDEDAKFNLEFVREEVKRRQEQQEQQQNQQNQNQDQQNQDQQDQQQQQQQEGAQPQDQDGDGLADEVEREGENPTDPTNPDTDGDGRSDGEEDRNGNGRVDEGETDPNRPDDSPQEGQEPSEAQQQPQQQEGEPREMTPEEAERFLQALQEERPEEQRKGQPGRRVRLEKDW